MLVTQDPTRTSADVLSLAEVARLAQGSLCSALKRLPKAVLHVERDLAQRTLTNQDAAAEIVALINRSPQHAVWRCGGPHSSGNRAGPTRGPNQSAFIDDAFDLSTAPRRRAYCDLS